MKKTAAIACLALGSSLLVDAASPAGSPQTSLKTSTNEQLLERIEAEVAFAKGLAGPMPANVVVSEVKEAEAELPAYGIATVRVTFKRAGA